VIGLVLMMSGEGFEFGQRKGFPAPPVPAENPMNAAKVELGRRLFYDVRLSVNGEQSCASCHRQELAFTDGLGQAKGSTGEVHPRGSMSLVNVGYLPALTWANPKMTLLEEQALVPMLGTQPVELGMGGREAELVERLGKVEIYQRLFREAFRGEAEPVRLENVTKALAAFQRTIVSMRSPYDRYRYDGDRSAIPEAAQRGEKLFFSGEKAGCFQCHGGWNLGRGEFFNTKVEPGQREEFRAPSLRNIALTAPYMHDGRFKTLEEVIAHYERTEIPPFEKPRLKEGERRDLVEFLKALTDEEMVRDVRWSDPWKQ